MRYAALVRALNVGGTGTLTMARLVACARHAGFADARTYLASGNVVFSSAAAEGKVKAALERALATEMGAKVDVLVRSHAELAALVAKNPFEGASPSRVIVFFLDAAPGKAELLADGRDGEEVRARGRDVFVHYPNGQGTSKLKLAFGKRATGRNLNTIGKLVELTA